MVNDPYLMTSCERCHTPLAADEATCWACTQEAGRDQQSGRFAAMGTSFNAVRRATPKEREAAKKVAEAAWKRPVPPDDDFGSALHAHMTLAQERYYQNHVRPLKFPEEAKPI